MYNRLFRHWLSFTNLHRRWVVSLAIYSKIRYTLYTNHMAIDSHIKLFYHRAYRMHFVISYARQTLRVSKYLISQARNVFFELSLTSNLIITSFLLFFFPLTSGGRESYNPAECVTSSSLVFLLVKLRSTPKKSLDTLTRTCRID